MALTPIQAKFVELEKKKEEYKVFTQEFNDAIKAVHDEVGVDGHFQDEEGIVYQITIPEGKFVYFDKIGYNRTKRVDEKKGSLSVKAAKELGYSVE
jgi:hypothetical protein